MAFGFEFGEHQEWNDHSVLFELKEGGWIAQQHRRVEYVGDCLLCVASRADTSTINASPFAGVDLPMNSSLQRCHRSRKHEAAVGLARKVDHLADGGDGNRPIDMREGMT